MGDCENPEKRGRHSAGIHGMNFRNLATVVPLLLLVSACTKSPPPLTRQEKQTVTELTANLKPRCVGRYVIDVPDDALSAGWATIQGVTFDATPMTPEKFGQAMAAHDAELKATRSRDGYQFVYDQGEVHGVPNSRYFVTLGNRNADSDLGRVIEAYKWDAGYQIKLRIEATDSIHSEFEKKMKGTPYEAKDWKVNDVPEKTSLVLSPGSCGRCDTDRARRLFPGWLSAAQSRER
jgi:hypothetical protein